MKSIKTINWRHHQPHRTLVSSGRNDPHTFKEAMMISRFIDRWFDELLNHTACIDILAGLPDNF